MIPHQHLPKNISRAEAHVHANIAPSVQENALTLFAWLTPTHPDDPRENLLWLNLSMLNNSPFCSHSIVFYQSTDHSTCLLI